MKRTRMMGLCLMAALAAFALSAIAASSASAGTYYVCAAHKKGEYTTATCATKSAKAHKGKYEKEPLNTCVAQKKGKYANAGCTVLDEKKGKPKGKYEKAKALGIKTVGGPAKLATPAFGPTDVTCKAATGTGTYTGSKTANIQIIFTGCEFEGLKCESAGPNSEPSHVAGDIETDLESAKLLDNPESIEYLDAETNTMQTYAPAVGEVGQTLVGAKESGTGSEKHAYSSEFNCGGVVFIRTYGEDTGVYQPTSVNHLTTTTEIAFKAKTGANGLLTEVLTESGWAGPAPSIEEAGVSTLTSEKSVEVRS